MNKRVLVVAPHPDDELLGCGGTLLRYRAEGHTIAWLVMTVVSSNAGWSDEQIENRKIEIQKVRDGLNIDPEHVYELDFPTAELDCVPMSVLVSKISEVFKSFKPDEVMLPYPGDVHSDHRVTFKAASACTKWFRYPSVKRVIAYETLSETDFGIDPRDVGFRPNVFVDVTTYMDRKIELMAIYVSEMGEYPFPRSERAIRSLATVRGTQSGFRMAEGFMLLLDRVG